MEREYIHLTHDSCNDLELFSLFIRRTNLKNKFKNCATMVHILQTRHNLVRTAKKCTN